MQVVLNIIIWGGVGFVIICAVLEIYDWRKERKNGKNSRKRRSKNDLQTTRRD